MDLMEMLQKVTNEALSFENHPCVELDEDIKIQYLNALTVIANIDDGEISKNKIEYLEILINSFGLSDDILDSFIEFAKSPDKDSIVEMILAFNTKDIKYNLIIDSLVIANRDDNYSDNAKDIINQYFIMLKLSQKEKEDLENIFKMINDKDETALAKYSLKKSIEQFDYILEYYDIKELNTQIAFNQSKAIEFEDNILAWYDEDTNLLWEVKSEENINNLYKLDGALEYAEELNSKNYLDYSDWRVPTKDELETLITKEKKNNYIKLSLSKNNISSCYWSSSTSRTFGIMRFHNTWHANFYQGFINQGDKDNDEYVRCVRAI